MKFRQNVILFLAVIILPYLLPAQSWDLAMRMGGSGSDFGLNHEVDAAGNIYTFSLPVGTVYLSPGSYITHGSVDMMVTKHDPNGNLIWHTLIGGTQQESGGGLALDSAGNIYVCGKFLGTMICGNDTLVASLEDICVIKLDPNGQFLWARKAGSSSSGTESAYSITYSYTDNSAVITGKLAGPSTFGSYTVSGSSAFFAKIDANGNWIWAYGANPTMVGLGMVVEVDVTGAIYLSYTAGATLHIKKYTSSGNMIWDMPASATSTSASAICFDQSGHFYIVGRNVTSFSFGSVSLPAAQNSDAGFLIKCDTAGNALWGLDFQSSSVYTTAVAVTNTGDVLVGGLFTSSLYVDTTIIADIYNGGPDAFVTKITSNGSVVWIKQIGTSGQDQVYGLSYRNGKVIFSGVVGGSINGNSWPLSSPVGYGGLDIVVSTFNDCAPPTTQVLPGTPLSICEGDSIHLYSSTTNPAFSYQWQANGVPLNGQTGTSLDIVGDPLYSGGYAIQVTSAGCTYISPYVPVIINPLPVVFTSTTLYSVNCYLDSIRLNATNVPLHSYQWLENNVPIPGATSFRYMVHVNGNYSVIVTSPFGCIDTFYYAPVTLGNYPVMTAGSDTVICPGEMVTLFVTGANTYSWSPASSLNSTTSTTPIATPNASTTYTVIGTIGTCRDTQYVDVLLYPTVAPAISFDGYQLSSSGGYVSYQWYLNSNAVAGATGQTYIPLVNGNYSVHVIDSNGCSVISNVILVLSTGIDLLKNDSAGVSVFPQPMVDQVTVRSPFLISEGTLELRSATGQIVRLIEISGASQIILDREGLSSGIYLLRITSVSGDLVSKIVVQ